MKSVYFCAVVAGASITVALADDDTPMLHPVEAVCIEYTMSGQMQNGTTTRCHRDYGYEAFEIQDISIGFGGFSQSQNQHVITIGDQIYSIDLSTNTGTQTTNPFYAQIVGALDDSDPQDMGNAFISAMGFTQTGGTKTIADTECNMYNSSMMGTMCMTDDGLMLEQTMMGNTQTATSVSIGDGGEDANYTLYQNVPISAGPDLSNMPNLQDLFDQGQQQ